MTDLDATKKTLRVWAIEETKEHGIRFKGPKKEAHKHTIQIDEELVAVLLAQVDKLKRLVAGVPDGSDIDLSLIKLPADALLFRRCRARGASSRSPSRATRRRSSNSRP